MCLAYERSAIMGNVIAFYVIELFKYYSIQFQDYRNDEQKMEDFFLLSLKRDEFSRSSNESIKCHVANLK